MSRGLAELAVVIGVLAIAGCAEHTVSFCLATLPSGDSIHVQELRRIRVEQRTILLCHTNGETQTLPVSGGGLWWVMQNSPEGFDVLQEGKRITVWEISGQKEEALATITVGDKRPGLLSLPPQDIEYTGQRLGCSICRTLSEVEVGDGEKVYLLMMSSRDVGSEANSDGFFLWWNAESQASRATTSRAVGTSILELKGKACLSDPLNSRPNFEMRWDEKRKAAWVVDGDTKEVLGGFQVEPLIFSQDGIPEYARGETGQVIANVGHP